MCNLTIDGRECTAGKDESVLDVARANGIFVPALCHHRAMQPYGACRLCLVEVEKAGRRRVVASCSYMAQEGLNVNTLAPDAVKARNISMELLLARCPGSAAVTAMAQKMGVTSTRFKKRESNCILCGLCIRVCRDIIGADCLSFSGRGTGRIVSTPYGKPAGACIGCGACAVVCPTGAIRLVEDGVAAILPEMQTVLRRTSCRTCGKHFATFRQMDAVREKLPELKEGILDLCPVCRRQQSAALM